MKFTTSIKNIAKHLILWVLGFLLLWFAFKGQDFSALIDKLYEVKWHWAIIILIITVLNHISRASRWTMTFRPMQYFPTISQSFLALMFGYIVSYVVPRMGEISRCLALKNEANIPVDKSLGTVVTERAVDVLCLGIVTLLAFLIEFERISTFFSIQLFEPILQRILTINFSGLIILSLIAISALALLFFLTKIFIRKYNEKIITFLKGVWLGINSVWYMENKVLFLLHTLFIWSTYFLMTYLWFYAFDATSNLAIGTGLSMMVIGSLGRLVPVQGGGMGAYHFLFQQGMLIYGVSEVYGLVLAIVIHGFQTIYYLIVGGVSTLILILRNSRMKKLF